MRRLAALSLLILLAGCFEGRDADGDGSAGDDDVTPVAPRVRLDPPTDFNFAPSQVIGSVGGGAEPSIAAASDGTLYVTTPLALWRSDDGGATWIEIGNPGCFQGLPVCPGLERAGAPEGLRGAGDADIWAAPDGRLHWLGLFDGDNAIPYQVSDDKGLSWSNVTDLAGDDSGDREWITGRADGTMFASWRNFPTQGDATIKSRTSYDGGASWTNSSDVAPDTRMGGIAVDPSSKALALAYDPDGTVHVAHSFDDGATWESVVAVSHAAQGQVFPVTSFDTNGTLYLAYAHDPDGAFGSESPAGTNRPLEITNVYLQVSQDKGLTWTDPVQVNPPGTTAWFPWIAAGGPGRIVVTWYQNDRGLPRQATDEVFAMAGVSLDADFPGPRFAYTRMSSESVHNGPECRENTGLCNRSFLDFFEVAIDPQGRAVSAWAKDTYPVPRVSVEAGVMATGPNLWEGGEFHT